ncbi:MAG: type VI secretion system tip protein TssI/VgrG [Desulfobacteraceae bacterium]|jgi:type VI secretion system secreted protein VgrG
MMLIRDIGLATGDPFLLFKNTRQFECEIEGEAFDVYEFSLKEKMFDIFRAEVTIVHDRRFKSEDLLGKKVVSKIVGRVSDRLIHGKIREYEELPMKGRYHLFKVIVVSDLWILTQIRNLRIFQNMSVPDIIHEVLKTSRIFVGYYAIRLMGTYPPREYCVQYRETNLDFIKRLMAEEGMFFYHEFAKDRHIPVVTDTWMHHNKIPGHSDVVIYSKKGQLVTLEDHITEFEASERMTVENIHLSDYHFKQSSGRIETKAACKDSVFFNIYDYPGYLVTDDMTCQQRVTVHLERETWKKKQFKGKGVCRQLLPGHVFTLADHLEDDYNTDYIVTSVTHTGKQPQVLRELEGSDEGTQYGNDFTCIPANVTYRPALIAKPSVKGIQSAVVTGPPNEEIYVDEWGRIKIKFHWDLLGQEERTSCWVRVSQIWAGGFGGPETIFTPRIGQEVLVDFLDGDPDRPMVVGTAYTNLAGPPYNLPEHKTRSTIKTHTVKGEGYNELRFEDLKGQEEIYIHGQKDWNIEILNDKGQTIGHDERLDVKNDRTKTVGHDQKEDIKNDKTITVGKNHTESIGENMKVTIGKNFDESTGENKTISVEKNFRKTVGVNSDIRVGGNETVEIAKNLTTTIKENSASSVGSDSTLRVGGKGVATVDKSILASAGDTFSATAESHFSIKSSGGDVIIQAGGATITITKKGDIKLTGANVSVDASGKITMNGTSINQN